LAGVREEAMLGAAADPARLAVVDVDHLTCPGRVMVLSALQADLAPLADL
jgi:hypothetical protein